MKLYPMPYEYVQINEFFLFSENLTIKYNEDFPHEKTLPLLAEFWYNFTNEIWNVEFVKDETLTPHTFSTGGVTAVLKAGFEHSLSVTKDGFAASADSHVGLIHAFMTLLQLIQPERIDNENFDKFHMSCCNANDKPALQFRCFHSSVGMSDYGNGSGRETHLMTVKKAIRTCGLMKYSHILVEFFGSIKFDCLKELAYDGAFTKDEIRPLFEEAKALGVELVPMFNCLGHVAIANNPRGQHVVLNRNPKLDALFEPDGWTVCLSNPQTRALLREVRRELIELCGDGKYFHMGGDEAYTLGTCDICSQRPIEDIYAEYINEVAEEMKSYGRRLMIWGDTMLDFNRWRYHHDRFNHPYEASMGTAPTAYKALDKLDRSVIITDWQYEIWDDDVITSQYFKEKGFDVVTASATEVKNTDALCNAGKKHGFLGHMQTVWTEAFDPILITRGGTSSWMEDIGQIEKLEHGEHNFIHEYMLMNHRSGALTRKLVPESFR